MRARTIAVRHTLSILLVVESTMNISLKRFLPIALVALSLLSTGALNYASAATAEDLNTDARQALQTLYKSQPLAEKLAKTAKAVLVFPNIVKAGLVFGGSYGEGVLMRGAEIEDYYNSVTGSWGLQIGAQSYGYAVFLMSEKAIAQLRDSKGLEIGVGPTVVVVDEGIAKNLSSSTLQDDAYAFIFDQQGLMAGVSIEGTKISKIRR
jgi:lipid-binding SYLF domain-containing protein